MQEVREKVPAFPPLPFERGGEVQKGEPTLKKGEMDNNQNPG